MTAIKRYFWLIVMLSAYGQVQAVDTWLLSGKPSAGRVNQIAVAVDGTIYAGGSCKRQVGFNKVDSEGVFKSVNKGATWTEATCIISRLGWGDYLQTLVVAPDGVIYAGTMNSGIFTSVDKGVTWTTAASSQGLTFNPGCVACDTASVRSFAVAPDGMLYAGTNLGVYQSVDKGATWTAMTRSAKGGMDANIHALGVADDGAIYAGAMMSGIFKSIDKGASWTAISNGLTDGNVKSFAIAPDGAIYAGGARDGVFKSLDKGSIWKESSHGYPSKGVGLLVLAADGTLYISGEFAVGVYKSVDKGANWTAANQGLKNVRVQSFATAVDGSLYAGTDDGRVYHLAASLPMKRKQVTDNLAPPNAPPQRPAYVDALLKTIMKSANDLGIQLDSGKVVELLESGKGAENGIFVGKVVAVDQRLGLVYQSLAGGVGAVHVAALLSQVPKIGDMVSISFKGAFGRVETKGTP